LVLLHIYQPTIRVVVLFPHLPKTE
jgi:hypothetical protein